MAAGGRGRTFAGPLKPKSPSSGRHTVLDVTARTALFPGRSAPLPHPTPRVPMPPPPDAACDERLRNLLFLSTPRLWPVWPFLPLIRRRAGCADECGLLYDLFGLKGTTGFSATVFLANLFTIPPTEPEFLALPHETFDSADEIFAAGWRVD